MRHSHLVPTAPLVSILLPVYNGALTLPDCLQSISEQTFRRFELIVVDDGSTDRSVEILGQVADRDDRIVVLRRRHQGIVAALRAAAEVARGDYLARIDADDRADPSRLARQVRWLQRRPALGAVGCLVRSFTDSGTITDGWRQYESWLNRRRTNDEIQRDLFVESPLAHPSTLIRSKAYHAVGGYRDFDGPEDYDLWLSLAGAGWELAKVPAVLLEWRDHPGRLTRTDPRYRPEAFLRLKAHHLARGPLGSAARPIWIWGAGRYGRHLARALEPEGIRPEAFIDIDPIKIGRTRRGRPIVAPEALRAAPEAMVLAAVPVPGARTLIRRRLNSLGRREGCDYICCA